VADEQDHRGEEERDPAEDPGVGADVIEGLFESVEQSESPDSGSSEGSTLVAVPSSPDPEVPVQEFFIPVHQFVRLTRREVQVVDHSAFQRLGTVFQLGHTYLVYRGATHQRHEHALGTLHVAQMIIDSLARNARSTLPEGEGGPWRIDSQLSSPEIAFIRLGALLHDIGHLPAGHTFEDELGLFSKHDSMERLELVLDRTDWSGSKATSLRELLDQIYAPDMEALGIDISPTELLLTLIASDYPEARAEAAGLGHSEPFRLSVARDLIGNTICADLLDYLHRDLHHLGKHKEFETRLIDYMEIRRNEERGESRLVVFLRDGDKLRHDAVSAVLNLLESRYQLFEVALYHRTKLAATAMLERSIGEIADHHAEGWTKSLPEELLDLSDFEMLGHFRETATRKNQRSRSQVSKERLQGAAENLVAVRQRRLHKKLYQRFLDQFALPDSHRIAAVYGHDPHGDPSAEETPATNRLQATRRLEGDFSLRPLSLGMYCPPYKMSTKVAGVSILREDEVRTLAQEEERDPRLTGGHLRAQEQRFKNLWHVYFSCAPDALEELQERGLRPLLIDAIDCFVLGLTTGPISLEERAMTIARTLAATPESSWHEKELVEEIRIAGRGEGKPGEFYPTGLPALGAFFQK
jgi:HD superfamily phosphohydrolase